MCFQGQFKQDKSKGFDNCDQSINLTQLEFKSTIFGGPQDLES